MSLSHSLQMIKNTCTFSPAMQVSWKLETFLWWTHALDRREEWQVLGTSVVEIDFSWCRTWHGHRAIQPLTDEHQWNTKACGYQELHMWTPTGHHWATLSPPSNQAVLVAPDLTQWDLNKHWLRNEIKNFSAHPKYDTAGYKTTIQAQVLPHKRPEHSQ